MKKPGQLFNVFTFIIFFIYSVSITVLFIIFYNFTSITDGGVTYTPFLYSEETQVIPLVSLMASFSSGAIFFEFILFIIALTCFTSNSLGKRSFAIISVFILGILIAACLIGDYLISYTYGLEYVYDPNWVPDASLIEKYVVYFTTAQTYQYAYFLDPTSVSTVFGFLLFLVILCLIITSVKYGSYNKRKMFEKNGNGIGGPANSTVIINNPANPNIPATKYIQPDIIRNPNNSIPNTNPVIINNPPLHQQNPAIINNIPPVSQQNPRIINNIPPSNIINDVLPTPVNINNQIQDPRRIHNQRVEIQRSDPRKVSKPIYVEIPERKAIIKPDLRKRTRFIHNNILLNKIMKEANNKLTDAKILIEKLAQVDDENSKNEYLALIYRSCLNNDYLTRELENAIYEKLGTKLPQQFLQNNTKKSIQYLLAYNKEGYKNIMNNLVDKI